MICLDRFRSDDQGTFGILYFNDKQMAFTCELPWKDNHHEISCIPCGLYNVEKYSSPLHPDVWQVMNVPERTAILIHTGNTIADVHGCICVGDKLGTVKGLPAVLHSMDTFATLKTELPDSFQMTIRSSLPIFNY